MTRALITGVTGCVGSNLAVTLLHQGLEVVGLCHPSAPTDAIEGLKIQRVRGDLLNPASLLPALQAVDWVFHVAAIADDWKYPPERVYATNVQGTRHLLAAALQAGVERFVYVSSAAALGGPRPQQPLLDETSPFNFQPAEWPYAHSKLLAEQAVQEYVHLGLPALSVLPTAILGPADSAMISGQLILRAARRQLFPLPHGGTNYIDVRDVAEAMLEAARHGQVGRRYLLAGHNLSHLHTLGVIGDALGLPIHYLNLPKPALPLVETAVGLAERVGLRPPLNRVRVRLSGQYLYYDNRRAVRELGLQPRPFDQTVEAAARWYHDHGLLVGYSRPLYRTDLAWESPQ